MERVRAPDFIRKRDLLDAVMVDPVRRSTIILLTRD